MVLAAPLEVSGHIAHIAVSGRDGRARLRGAPADEIHAPRRAVVARPRAVLGLVARALAVAHLARRRADKRRRAACAAGRHAVPGGDAGRQAGDVHRIGLVRRARLVQRRQLERHRMPRPAVVVGDALHAVAANKPKGRAVKIEYHAAAHLVAAPQLLDRAGASHAVKLRKQAARQLLQAPRAGGGLHHLNVLQQTIPPDARRVAGLCAGVGALVGLGRDYYRVAQVGDAVLACHLAERPSDVERGQVGRRLVPCTDGRLGKRLHHKTVLAHIILIGFAGFSRARFQYVAEDVGGRVARP